MADKIAIMVVLPSLFAAIAFAIWTIAHAWQRRQHIRAVSDFHAKLLDRVSSIKDFSEFLQTDGGVRFMSSLGSAPRTTGPSDRILLATQIGIVLSTLGLGFLSLNRLLALDNAVGFTICGVIALSIGIGFLLSSGVSYWLARSLGVLQMSGGRHEVPDTM